MAKDYINLIKVELDKAEKLSSNLAREEIAMFKVKTANQTLYEASLLPIPVSLWDPFGLKANCVVYLLTVTLVNQFWQFK